MSVIGWLRIRDLELVTRTFLGLANSGNVGGVRTDMYRNYLDAARQAFPNAMPVVDKFHVVKMGNEAMEQVRKTIKKGLPDKDRRLLKNDRKLMLMRERDLTTIQKHQVGEWFDKFPQLEAATVILNGQRPVRIV